jgi:hypothetical protein
MPAHFDRVHLALNAGASHREHDGAREIAFVDPNISDLDTLLAGMRPDVETILLTADEPAPRQMARSLAGRQGLEAVHVIAHGRPGEVSFAAGALTSKNLADEVGDLAAIGETLGDGGLLLWTCSTAQGRLGPIS